jgi:two-component system, NtrC family, sensor histidine kinase GlrK
MISHELRTPLTTIKEGSSLLLDRVAGPVTEKQEKLLGILAAETRRLIELVNSILDLSKMEAGMMSYTLEEGSVGPLIEQAVTEMAPLMETRRIRLETLISDELPLSRIDTERILQVLRNLIGNAIKFTPEGGRITVYARGSDTGVEVTVEDTGVGIPKEHLATIFERFQTADRKKGTGLGLAIVKHIITAHGGKVWVENRPGGGAIFAFVLPS